jgi:transcriptional regulator with XRE-family HTH domain
MTMTASQFLAARRTLGLTQEEVAGELDLTPHVIAGIENGEARVPKDIEKELNWRVAVAHRDALLAASGLPECPVVLKLEEQLERLATNKTADEFEKALDAASAHMDSCPTCKARSVYAAKYGPPIPEMPLPGWMRAADYLERLVQRLPEAVRPPEGDKGEGRRIGVFIAAFFSLIAIGIALVGAIARLVAWGLGSSWWRESLAIIALVPLTYLVAFFLAGTVYDLTRPIARRFLGYVIRGGLIVPALYGAVGLVAPFISKRASWSYWPGMVLAFCIIGALGGGMLWVVDRLKGKLPRAAT